MNKQTTRILVDEELLLEVKRMTDESGFGIGDGYGAGSGTISGSGYGYGYGTKSGLRYGYGQGDSEGFGSANGAAGYKQYDINISLNEGKSK